MARIVGLVDDHGVLREADKVLSDDLKAHLVGSLAELEDNECHRTRTFPRTRLHRVVGWKQAVYRADIEKTSGWRLHVQYVKGRIYVRDIVSGQDHDAVIRVIRSKKDRYT